MIAAGFDLETTGLLEDSHRIVEICLALYDVDSGRQLGKFVERFNPGRPIDPKATEVHGIRFEDVAHLPTLDDNARAIEVIQRIANKSDFWVAHNGLAFDKPFIEKEFARIGKQLFVPTMIDTMVDGRWATPLGKVPNLGELCFACRVPYDPSLAHAADYDVERMMDCFWFALKRGFYSLPSQLQLKAAA
jgi:DNA polymerase III subunit epsilon